MLFKYFYRVSATCFCTLLLFVSCVREPTTSSGKAGEHWIPGSNDGIEDIDQFKSFDLIFPPELGKQSLNAKQLLDKAVSEGKIIKIKTSSEGGESFRFSNSVEKSKLDPDLSFANQPVILNYEILDVKTNTQKKLASLLGKVENFKGFSNEEYYIAPRLEGDYLVLYRVGELNKIPYDEKPMGIKLGNMMATPLLGYEVKYCVKESERNVHDEVTGRIRPKCAGISKESAEYLYLDDKRLIFSYLDKKDLFSAVFFKGEWLYTRTLIKSPSNLIGYQPPTRVDFVKFRKTIDGLVMVDASSDLMEEDRQVGGTFYGEWEAYEQNRDSIDHWNHLGERKVEKGETLSRPYIKLNLHEFADKEGGLGEFVRSTVSDGYFSFTYQSSGANGFEWIKLAFKRVSSQSNYVEKKWFEEDSTLYFPMFGIKRIAFVGFGEHTKEDHEKFLRAVRFDPKANVIKWYFSTQTSKKEWVRELARKAVHYINLAFQEARGEGDQKILIKLDESEEKELGDIRYNIINMLETEYKKGSGFLIGYGPNVANPRTGEVISGTANVWVSEIIDNLVALTRNYVRLRIYPPAWVWPGSSGVSDFFEKSIKVKCPEVMEFIVSQRGKGNRLHPSMDPLEDREIVNDCAVRLSMSQILSITMHEMMHAFGDRHVFSSSEDDKNYYKNYGEIVKIFGKSSVEPMIYANPDQPPKFSSLMDYGYTQYPSLTVPGKYDIAFLRFLYFNKVELSDGTFLKIPDGADADPQNPQKSIEEIIKKKNVSLKKYKICGGFSGSDGIREGQHICIAFDYGSTPLEVVQNLIRSAKNGMLLFTRRYDDLALKNENIFLTFLSILEYLHLKWQPGYLGPLLRGQSKNIYDYSPYDEQDIDEFRNLLLRKVEQDPDSLFAQYYAIREPLFNFYKELLFLPTKHCIYKRVDGSYKAVSIDRIIDQIIPDLSENSRKVLIDCQSDAVEDWANRMNMGELFTEVGYFGQSRRYFLKERNTDTLDEGTPFNYILLSSVVRNGFNLILMKEPQFYKETSHSIREYVLEGEDLNLYLDLDMEIPRAFSYAVTRTHLRLANARSKLLFHEEISRVQNLKDFQSKEYKDLNADSKIVGISIDFLSDYIERVEEYSVLYKEKLPSLYDLYQRFLDQDQQKEFADFFLFQPEIFQVPSSVTTQRMESILVPYAINGYTAEVIKKYNENKTCLKKEEDEHIPCPDRLDKIGHNEFLYQVIKRRTVPLKN